MKSKPTWYLPTKIIGASKVVWEHVEAFDIKITHLKLLDHENLLLDSLPPTLQHLYLGSGFNEPLLNLPPSLKVLIFGKERNTPYEHPLCTFPASLQVFAAPTILLAPISPFSPVLTHISLGKYFMGKTTKILASLPQTLTYFKSSSNVDLEYLPTSVTHLVLKNFQQEMPKYLPNVTHLALGKQVTRIISFPPTLTHLHFSSKSLFNTRFICPAALTHLWLGDYFDQKLALPIILQFLRYGRGFVSLIPFLPCLTQLALPQNLNVKVNMDQLPSLQEILVEK